VITLEWLGTAEEYVGGIWRIRRVEGDADYPWCLDVVESRHPIPGAAVVPARTRHRTLCAARATALHFEIKRRRTVRAQRHLAVAVLAAVGFIALLPFTSQLAAYVVAVGLAGLAVGQATRAVEVRFSSHWGRSPRAEEITWLDRTVARWLDQPPSGASDRSGPRDPIKLLPPG
jgi:hypothetical protein